MHEGSVLPHPVLSAETAAGPGWGAHPVVSTRGRRVEGVARTGAHDVGHDRVGVARAVPMDGRRLDEREHRRPRARGGRRDAADHRADRQAELGLDHRQAEQLLPKISEAYIKGRTDGADIFAEQVNRALATRGIHVAVAVQHATVRLLDED